jgi:hypothetical protein
MGVNTASVTKVLLTNVKAANTGTSLATIAEGDVLVLNKNMAVLTGTPKVSDAGCDVIYIALGLADGKFELSQPIQLNGVISAKVKPYGAYVKQKSKFTLPAPTAGDVVKVTVIQKDEHRIHVQRQSRRFYEIVAASGETATTLAVKFKDKINADKASCVTATTSGADLILTANSVPQSYMDTFARILFDAGLSKDGVKLADLVVVDAPSMGNGTPELMQELERSTFRAQRIAHPIPDVKLKAISGGRYNSLVIMHRNQHNGDFSGVVSSPMTAFISFETGVNVDAVTLEPSAKQAAVVGVLESLIESAGKNVQ